MMMSLGRQEVEPTAFDGDRGKHDLPSTVVLPVASGLLLERAPPSPFSTPLSLGLKHHGSGPHKTRK